MKRLYLIVLILVIGCQQTGICQDKPTLSTIANVTSNEAKPDEQLEIFKNALLTDPNEEIRIKAAGVLLAHENRMYRESLLKVLELTTNSMARIAVCKALIQTRSSTEPVKDIDDFIKPLLGILSSEITAEARTAGEATLIFEYNKIGPLLENLATDTSIPVRTRLNAIQALKRSDMTAIIKLIRLVDDPEKQISEAAENALHSIGMPIGKDAITREQMIYELQRKDKDEFLREWLIRQEAQIRQMRAKLNSWQEKYLSALNKIYVSINDDVARGKFLVENLSDSETVIKLWALEKVSQWIKGTQGNLTAELDPILVNLISDTDRDVRLQTAMLLSLMTRVNSAQKLLTQLKAETDEQVKDELLVALGGACSYALSSSSSVQISPEIRKQALEWAKKYLFEQDAIKAQKGAEVMRKLLEPAGLTPEELDIYLGLLVERYNQQSNPNETLRGELLRTMAGLCTQGSSCKNKAAELFRPLFIEALGDKTDSVRETAADGLIYINPTSALQRLRAFINDPSVVLRKKVIELAGESGGQEDLSWLSEKIGVNSEGGPAWQAMRKIFNGSDSAVLNEWMDKLTSQSSSVSLSDENKIIFLKIVETKAAGENKLALLKTVREKLAGLYYKIGQFDRAADYLDNLYKSAQTDKEKEAILPSLLGAYLRGSKVELAAELVTECLAKQDLGPENIVIGSIDSYLNEPTAGTDPNTVVKILSEIKPPSSRPKWTRWLKNWTERLSKGKEAAKSEEATRS